MCCCGARLELSSRDNLCSRLVGLLNLLIGYRVGVAGGGGGVGRGGGTEGARVGVVGRHEGFAAVGLG